MDDGSEYDGAGDLGVGEVDSDRLSAALRDALAVIPEPPTGDTSVDAAVSRLSELPDRPVRDHVAVFEAIHGALQDRLADAEE